MRSSGCILLTLKNKYTVSGLINVIPSQIKIATGKFAKKDEACSAKPIAKNNMASVAMFKDSSSSAKN